MRYLGKLLLCLLFLPLFAGFLACGVSTAGSFSLSLDRSTVTLAPGATTTVSVTPSGSNNFKGQVYLAVNGLPPGVTITPANATVNTGVSQQFTLSAAPSAAAGNVSIQFSGTSGTLTSATTLALTVSAPPPGPRPDFTLTADPAVSVVAGGSGNLTLTATAVNGYSGTVAVATTGLPTGVTLSPATISLVPGTPQQVQVNVASTVAAGTSTLTFTGTDTAGTAGIGPHTATTALTVTSATPPPSPDFSLSLAPASLSITVGSSGQTAVSVAAINGFTDKVTLAITGLPAGVTAAPVSTQASVGTPDAVVFTVSSSATAGITPITITGTDGTLLHTATLSLSVVAPAGAPDFSFSVNPGSLTIAVGGTAQAGLSATALGSFQGNVNVAITGLPTGVKVSPVTPSLTPGLPQFVTFTVASTTAAGTYTVTFTGTGGTNQHTATMSLIIISPAPPQDFSLTLAPTSLSLAQGASQSVIVEADTNSGFTANIAVSITGLPNGVTASPSTFTLAPGASLQVTLTAAANATIVSQTVAFTGNSGALSHTAFLTLNVTPAQATGDFSLTITPTSEDIDLGTSGQAIAVLATASNGFTGTVNVAISGLPNGVTASPATLALTPGTAQNVTLSASATAQTGNADVTFTGTSAALTHTADLALNVTDPRPVGDFTLTLTPATEGITQGASGQPIAVLATGSNGFTGPVVVSISGLPNGVTASPATLSLSPGQAQNVTLSASTTAQTGAATVAFTGVTGTLSHEADLALNITAPLKPTVDVTTYHYDTLRTGLNASETTLTLTNVNAGSFGKLGFDAVDGKVDAQPLYVSAVRVNGQDHNVLYVATEHGSLYAFDADNGQQLWQVSELGTGETPSDDQGCNQITPEIGITATPVIDRKYGTNGAIFLVGMSKDANGAYHQRLHAFELSSGAEVGGGPTEISASYPGNGVTSQNGSNVFDPGQYAERASLLLQGGNIYLAWTSHCDHGSYSGWVMSYSEATLQQLSVLNLTPNGSDGSIWMSGGGLAADATGNVYLLDANGTFDTTLNASGFPINGDYGNSFLKLSSSNGTLSVADYFEPPNGPQESAQDLDLGSGGIILLPDIPIGKSLTLQLAVGAGKDGNIYIVDRKNMHGKPSDPPFPITQSNALPNGEFGSPAYFNGTLYYGGVGDHLKTVSVFSFGATPTSTQSATQFAYPGTTPSISANGTKSAIVWALESSESAAAVLHAYDASNLATELYNSNQASGGRDTFGNGNKFITPMVVNGKVYVGTPSGVAVFGLLP